MNPETQKSSVNPRFSEKKRTILYLLEARGARLLARDALREVHLSADTDINDYQRAIEQAHKYVRELQEFHRAIARSLALCSSFDSDTKYGVAIRLCYSDIETCIKSIRELILEIHRRWFISACDDLDDKLFDDGSSVRHIAEPGESVGHINPETLARVITDEIARDSQSQNKGAPHE